MRQVPTIMVSGGMDPLHVGHVHLLQDAARHGRVIVALNSDEWLMRKKGYVFMPWRDRAFILRALSCVSSVVPVQDEDGSVCEAIRSERPTCFANGGDRTAENTPEIELCKEVGVKLLFNVGGGKYASSSALVTHANAGIRGRHVSEQGILGARG